MKKKTRVWLIVLGVLVLAAAVYVSGVFNPNRYLLVRNESEDSFRQISVRFSFRGTVFPEYDGISTISKLSGIPGDNTYYPMAPGEQHVMHLYARKGAAIGKTAAIRLTADGLPALPADCDGETVDIPIRRGCCTKLIIRGSSKAGYELEVAGFANWLIPQVEDLL